MKNHLTFALLFAGLFSFNLYANECLAKQGQIIEALSFDGQTYCDFTVVMKVGDDFCEVETTENFVCAVTPTGSFGGPYVWTGQAINDPNSPPEIDPEQYEPVLPPEKPDLPPLAIGENPSSTDGRIQVLSQLNEMAFDHLAETQITVVENQKKILDNQQFALGFAVNASSAANRASNTAIQTQNNLISKLQQTQSSLDTNAFVRYSDLKETINRNFEEAELSDSATDEELLSLVRSTKATGEYNQAMVNNISSLIGGGGGGGGDCGFFECPPQPSVIGELQSVNEKLSLTPSYLSSIENKLSTQSFDIRSISDNTFFTRLNTSTTNSLLTQTNSKLDELISSGGSGGSGNNSDVITHEKLDGISDQIAQFTAEGTGKNDGPTLCTGDDCYKSKSWIEPKYPEGMKTVYDAHKEAFQQSSVNQYLQAFNPTISGTLVESWQFCFNFDFVSLGCHDVAIPPYVLSFVRLIVLITAGFLARRLIFGG